MSAGLFGHIERHSVQRLRRARPTYGLARLQPGVVVFFCELLFKALAQPALFRVLGGLFLFRHIVSFTPRIRQVDIYSQ